MGAVELFGKLVNDNYKRHPVFTHNQIKLGYATQAMLLKTKQDEQQLPSQRILTQISMKYTRALLQHSKRSAMVNLFIPCEMLRAMGAFGKTGRLLFPVFGGAGDVSCAGESYFAGNRRGFVVL